ncbi:UNVERIFIED_CONTAM: hypothetical protein RMT77_011337 [Armadillidium vulgare]
MNFNTVLRSYSDTESDPCVNEESNIYDLAQNYLFVKEQTPLKYNCATSIVSYIFKSEYIINEIRSIELPNHRQFKVVEEWDVIVKKVEKIAIKWVFSNHFHDLIKEVVAFTASEIYLFLLKNRFFDRSLFLKNLVYTPQGTINTYKTVLEILKNDDITNELKFEIACFYFVGKSVIEDCFNKIPHSSRVVYLRLEDVDFKKRVTIFYWFHRLNFIDQDDFDNFLIKSNNELDSSADRSIPIFSTLNILLLWAVYCVNDTAVSYLCRKFRVYFNPPIFLKKFFLINGFGTDHQNLSNIYMYLHFDNGGRDLDFFSIMKHIFLQTIVSRRWICLFFKFLEDYQKTYDDVEYSIILRKIVESLVTNLMKKLYSKNYKNTLNSYINLMPSTAKEFLKNKAQSEYFCLVQYLLLARDKESAISILSFGNAEKFFGNTIFFLQLLKETEFALIDQCMKGILTPITAIKLRQRIFLNHAGEVCTKFILFNSWNSLNSFLKWGSSFFSLQYIVNFKKSIPFLSNGTVIKLIVFATKLNIKDYKFKFADSVLFWCLGSKDFVSMYKKRAVLAGTDLEDVNECINFYQEIINCILNRKLKFLNKLFLWASCSPEEVKFVKKKLKKDDAFLNLICKRNNIKLLLSFVKWCKDDEEETKKLRKDLYVRYHKILHKDIFSKICLNPSDKKISNPLRTQRTFPLIIPSPIPLLPFEWAWP